ncbi:MAG: ABC transporter permease [Coriobacteriales bacterium]
MASTEVATQHSEVSVQQSQARRNWFILSSLVSRDFKRKYRRSFLGVLWSVLNPLLMMIVVAAVFSYMFRFNIEHFPVYLILGQTLFDFMSRATSGSMSSIIDNSSLIKKVRIEKVLFPLEKVLFELLNFAISLIAVFGVMAFFRITPSANMLLLPVLCFYVFLFSAGIGMLLAAGAVFFRDLLHLWSVLLTAWTYATPLFYPVEMLAPWMITVMQFNPMYHYVKYFRNIMLYGTTPSLLANLLCLAMALGSFLLGLLVFRKTQNRFILFV